MDVSELEMKVIERFLSDPNLTFLTPSLRWEATKVKDRSMTGAGFLTEFEHSEELKVLGNGVSLRWGKVGARLSSSKIETGYLVYVDDGYLTAVEGYTYGDEWPPDIDRIEMYELKEGQELKTPPSD
jgi:hypothetical protein